MKKLRIILSLLLLLSSLFWGCTSANTKIELNEIGSYPRPLIDPLPLNIDVYYKKEFKEFETTVIPLITMKSSDPKYNDMFLGHYGPWHIQLGKSNVALFDYILHNVFKEVRPADHIPEDILKMENIDAIIEPSINYYDCDFIQRGLKLECYVKISYIVKFHVRDRKDTFSWLVKGEGSGFGYVKSPGTILKEATKVSMRDVAAKFIVDFCKHEEIKQIFNNQCNQ